MIFFVLNELWHFVLFEEVVHVTYIVYLYVESCPL